MANQRLKKENRANQALGRSAVAAVMQSLGPNGITKSTDIAAGVPGLGPHRFRAAAAGAAVVGDSAGCHVSKEIYASTWISEKSTKCRLIPDPGLNPGISRAATVAP